MRSVTILCLFVFLVVGNAAVSMGPPPEKKVAGDRPNILFILVDDMGYTDAGFMGSEIDTPNLDQLAASGIILTNLHTTPVCSTSRAMLMSGMDNHLSGVGMFPEALALNQKNKPGYEGYLNFRVAALPEVMRDGGYHTYMSGKWHLGIEDEHDPAVRGFERVFALRSGGGGHFTGLGINKERVPIYSENGTVTTIPEDFYSTEYYADRMIEFIKTARTDGKPFFGFLSLTAPHWPLQAPDTAIRKYEGRYDSGYDALHARRIQELNAKGYFNKPIEPAVRPVNTPDWNELSAEEKKVASRTMEIYAAMVDLIDVHIGRVVEVLKETGEYDNTVIFFMSDNGAEGHPVGTTFPAIAAYIKECCDTSYENMGHADSYIWQGPGWAWASGAPFRMYKGNTTEGGIVAPAFVHYPKKIKSGTVNHGFVSLMDIMPTLLELAGIRHPGANFLGRSVLPMQGISMLPMLYGSRGDTHGDIFIMGWEFNGKKAVRKGNWKIVQMPPPHGNGNWQLYNLADDTAEQNDLIDEHPEILEGLLIQWEKSVKDNGIIISDKFVNY